MGYRSEQFKCASIGIFGRPNAGKSTLLNALLGSHLSAISDRPQTTRANVKGIHQFYNDQKEWAGQLVFVDTPGINFSKGLLERSMHSSVEGAFDGLEMAIWVADCRKLKEDLRNLEMQKSGEDRVTDWLEMSLRKNQKKLPWILVLTKVDLVSKAELLPIIEKASEVLPEFKHIVPVAALLGKNEAKSNLGALTEVLWDFSPEGEPIYPEEYWTDQRERDLIKKFVLECVFNQTKKEVPYLTDCTIARFIDADPDLDKKAEVDVVIWVSRSSLKRILIGAKGQRIKEIGMAARKRFQEVTGQEIILRSFVKVVDKWEQKHSHMQELGYDVRR